MAEDKNPQTPITVQPFDQQSYNSSSKKAHQGAGEGAAKKADTANRATGASATGGNAAQAQGSATPSGAPSPKPAGTGPGATARPFSASSQPTQPIHPITDQIPPDFPQPRVAPAPFQPMPGQNGSGSSSSEESYGYTAFDPSSQDALLEEELEMLKNRRKGNLLLIGTIACIVAIAILIITLLVVEFKPFGLFSNEFTVEAPSMSTVQNDFEKAKLPDLDLDVYRYIEKDNLKKTEISNYQIGEVKYTGAGDTRGANCEAQATVKYANESINATQQVYMTMDYNRSSNEWKASTMRGGNVEVKPVGAPNTKMILDNFQNILKSYDPELATMYTGAETTQESSLNEKGGTMVVTLKKKVDNGQPPAEGAEPQTLTCTVKTEISWNSSLGWVVKIVSVEGDIATTPQQSSSSSSAAASSSADTAAQPPAPADNGGNNNNNNGGNNNSNNNSGSGSGSGSGGGSGSGQTITTETEVHILQLICGPEDLVEVPGTITIEGNKVLLKTDEQIRVIFSGQTYNTNYFELKGQGTWNPGSHVVVIGTVSATGQSEKAPLVIKV